MQEIAFRAPPCAHPGIKFVLHGSKYEQNPYNPNRDKWHFSMSIRLECELCNELMFRPLHSRWGTIYNPFWADHPQCDVSDAPCPMATGVWGNGTCEHKLEKIIDARDINVITPTPYPKALDGVYMCSICKYVYVQHKVTTSAISPSISSVLMPIFIKWMFYVLVGYTIGKFAQT